MTEQNTQPGAGQAQPQTYADPATGQLYTVDPATGQSVWVTDPATGQPLKAGGPDAAPGAPAGTFQAAPSPAQPSSPAAAQTPPSAVPPQAAAKKPFYKKWWFWVLAVLLLAIIAAGGSGGESEEGADTAASGEATTTAEQASSPAQESNAEDEQASEEADGDAEEPSEIAVPDVVGKTLSDAYGELEDFNLVYQKADGSEASVWSRSNWRIDATEPAAGTTVPSGSDLVLTMTNTEDEKREAKKAEEAAQEAAARESIEYTDVSAGQLVADLDANAMNAKETYQGGNYRISGLVRNIDASGKYISIEPEDDPWTFTTIRCDVVYDDTADAIRQLSTGQFVYICGEITDVGEVLGYSVDINRIEF